MTNLSRATVRIKMKLLFICAFWVTTGMLHAYAQKGFLDLGGRGTFLEEEYLLDGEWEFYWNQLLSPQDFEEGSHPTPEYISVPGSWSGSFFEKQYPVTGYATYRLRVHLPVDPDLNDIIFNLRTIRTAYRIWVNGHTLVRSGSVAVSEEKSNPKHQHLMVPYHVTNRNLDIIVQVSNYEHRAGGMRHAIAIARADRSIANFRSSIAFEFFLIGSLFIMSLYHIGLSVFHKEKNGALYFGLLCLVIMLRTMFTGSILISSLFPEINYYFQLKFEFITVGLAMPLFLLYSRTVFPNEFKVSVLKTYIALFAIISILQAVIPIRYAGYLNLPEMALILPPAMYITLIALQSTLQKNPAGRVFFFGWLLLFLTILNDILVANEILHNTQLVSIGIIGFTFSQAILIAMRFARAYESVEELSLQLSRANSELTDLQQGLENKIRNRTMELNRSLREIKTDIAMAKRIQSALFSAPRMKFKTAEIYCKYIPMLEVGGDFYDIFEMPDGRIRILVADATGHGVRGAMITIAIKAEYEPLKKLFDTPKLLLRSLNRNYIDKYNSLGSYLSAIVADYDPVNMSLTYSVAGHPPPILISKGGDLTLPSVSGSLIGLFPDAEYENHGLSLKENDRLYLYSDGLFDQFNPEKELIAEEVVFDLLKTHSGYSLTQTMEAILNLQTRHLRGATRSDDMTIVALEVKGDNHTEDE